MFRECEKYFPGGFGFANKQHCQSPILKIGLMYGIVKPPWRR